MCDEENVFYSGYHSMFEEQFPTDSGSERFKMDIRAGHRAVIRFYAQVQQVISQSLYKLETSGLTYSTR